WSGIRPGAPGKGKMLANRRAEHRFLHFADADAWLAYNGRFGAGSPFDAMMGHVDAMSRDIAAMEILGPNPEATVKWLGDSLIASAQRGDADARTIGRAEAGAKQVRRLWDEYS